MFDANTCPRVCNSFLCVFDETLRCKIGRLSRKRGPSPAVTPYPHPPPSPRLREDAHDSPVVGNVKARKAEHTLAWIGAMVIVSKVHERLPAKLCWVFFSTQMQTLGGVRTQEQKQQQVNRRYIGEAKGKHNDGVNDRKVNKGHDRLLQ